MNRGTPAIGAELPRACFRAAAACLAVAALLGVSLRLWGEPVSGWLDYRHVVHAHSHIAFLGWLFNAFIGAGLALFPGSSRPGDRRAWWVLQAGVAGMLASYPFQGYGPVSIAFSTLHLAASAWFAAGLWRGGGGAGAAGIALRIGLAWFLVSGLGPLALGPLAATGHRESPAYTLAIYFYLHAQYNGWFVFFPIAAFLKLAERHGGRPGAGVSGALVRLAAGTVLTFAQSALWLGPPPAVWACAAIGGLLQLSALPALLRAVRAGAGGDPLVNALAGLGAVALAIKFLLQLLSAWPALAGVAFHHSLVIAFLHLVFLGVASPSALALARSCGWLRDGPWERGALLGLLVPAALTSLLLAAGAFGGAFATPTVLAALAALMAFSALLLALRVLASPQS